MKSYWQNIAEGIQSSLIGIKITLKHLWKARKRREQIYVSNQNYFEEKEGRVTLQYPKETLPLPDIGRYQLHNEMDDCIVCDKCAKICPVDCIDIEPIKSVGEFGKTSDGTSKRLYAAKFDIDMAKCCFCGLCTTVCPTECLTMTDEYDFSVTNILEHNFKFGNLSETEIEEKKALYEQYTKEKEEAKKKEQQEKEALKAQEKETQESSDNSENKEETQKTAKITFKPKFKPK
jgi:formate hydrogenlyase subunit 6/NADH:ubiquinone oxidoreductase subunit I